MARKRFSPEQIITMLRDYGIILLKEESAPGPIRTGDLRIRSPTLYPAELQARGTGVF